MVTLPRSASYSSNKPIANMTKLYGFVLLLSLIVSPMTGEAQQISKDSAWTDFVVVGNAAKNSTFMHGAPDKRFATFENTSESYIYFRPFGSTLQHPIKPNATLVVFGAKDPSIDPNTSGMFVRFVKEASGQPIYSDYYRVRDSVNVIRVPDTQFTYVEFKMLRPTGVGLEVEEFKRFYVDAVLLIQDFDPLSVLRSNVFTQRGSLRSVYPNPVSVEGAHVEYVVTQPGEAEIVLFDLRGSEAFRVALGYQVPGRQTAVIHPEQSGLFFAQLFVGGSPTGKSLKVTVE